MRHKIIFSVILIALLLAVVCSVTVFAATEEQVLLADTNTEVVISTAGQPVCFQFVPEHSCVYTFHSLSQEDTYAELYDAEGTLLYENDDYYGLNFGIECLLEAGKEYRLLVYFLDTLSTGSFELVTTTDHDVISTLTKPADCMEEGLWSHRCMICDHRWTETIPAEHQYTDGVCQQCGEAIVLEGACGEGLTWHYDGATKSLTVSGTGAMEDYHEDAPPWEEVATAVCHLSIAEGVTYIGSNAFSGMESLSAVKLPTSVTKIADNGFSYCTALKEVEIPTGVDTLGTYCFAYCDQLKNVTLSDTVTQIGMDAFRGCRSLMGIWVHENNRSYASDQRGVLFDKEMQCLIQVPAGFVGAYSVPDTVTVIGESAFEGCKELSAVSISDTVTQIQSNAFSGCDSLVFLRIPESVRLIGDFAINHCLSLEGVLFAGNAPTAEGAILEELSATAYYPASNETWTDQCRQQLGPELTWSALSQLTILAQPRTAEGLIGNSITFAVGAYGQGLQYCWWVAEPNGQTFEPTAMDEDTYTLIVTPETLGQRLYCVITDETGATVQTETVSVWAIRELTVGETITLGILTENEPQRLSFTPDRSCFYTFTSFGEKDAYCEVYTSDYTLVKAADDSQDHNFSLRVFLEAGKSYIFSVGLHENATATVQLQLEADHEYVQTVMAPTCTQGGYTEYVCSCGVSYVTDLTPAAEHKYTITRTDPTCVESGSIKSVCSACGDTKTTVLFASGHSFASGVCTKCGALNPVTQPTLTLKAPTLEFKDMITVNAMFEATNLDSVIEMGMITYSAKVSSWSVGTAEYVIPGTTYDAATGRYIATSQGIHAKYLGDTVYLAVYAKLTDGSYVYSKLASYSPVQYATGKLKGDDVPLKQLVVAMLNYGAAAQLHFGHNVQSLANGTLTAEQIAWPESYRSDMVATVASASTEKQGAFANNQGFSKRYPSISFEGAFCINYFFTPSYAPDNGITLYYWSAADYEAAELLTAANATGTMKLEDIGNGQYRGDITGIAAKALSEAVYVAAAYKSNGTVWTSGVLDYSIGAYCASQSTKGGTIADLAMATAVYGYHAKQYFGS